MSSSSTEPASERWPGLNWLCLPFEALSAARLYRCLRLRSEVFVVEQQCVFLDMDNADAACHHLLAEQGSGQGEPRLLACARLVPPGLKFAEASIGRVVTDPASRGGGLGHALMARAVREVQRLWGAQPIRIGAQAHLEGFYNQHGFVSDDKPYLEDGIPHLEMVRRGPGTHTGAT